MPVFSGGSGGFEILTVYTGGYLIGFLVAALIMDFCRKLGWNNLTTKILLAMFLGTVIILIFGYVQLSFFLGLEQAFLKGILPFLSGALIKIIVGSLPFIAINWWRKNK